MPHCACGRPITERSSENRYCSYCGMAYVVSCENNTCPNRLEGIAVRQSASCPACGLLYRYDPGTATPRLVRSTGPFVAGSTAGGTASGAGLVDLLPASGDPEADGALLAARLAEFAPTTAPANFSFGRSPIASPQARHGRIYVIPQNGSLVALDAETMQPRRGWRSETLPGWQARDLGDVRLGVSEGVVTILHRGHLHGLDAGTGRVLFDLPVEDLGAPHVLLARGRLLVLDTHSGQPNSLRLYDLEHLCDTRQLRKQPIWSDTVPGAGGAAVDLPAERLTARGEWFYLLSSSGQLLAVSAERGGLDTIYPNYGNAGIHAWSIGRKVGVVVVTPPAPGGMYGLVTFRTGSVETANEIKELAVVRLPPVPRTILIWDTDVLLLDEEGLLQRLPVESPNTPVARWGLLKGLNPERVEAPVLVPWGGTARVLLPFRESLSYRFRHVGLQEASGAFGSDLAGARPQARDEVRTLFCGPHVYLCNLNDGSIHRFLLF